MERSTQPASSGPAALETGLEGQIEPLLREACNEPGWLAVGLASKRRRSLQLFEAPSEELYQDLELMAAISGDLLDASSAGPLPELLLEAADSEAPPPAFAEALVLGTDTAVIFSCPTESKDQVLIAICSTDEKLALLIATVRQLAKQLI